MKKVPKSPRFIITTVAVALFGLIVGSPAWGQKTLPKDLFGNYTVVAHNTRPNNDSNHEKATYIIFEVAGSPTLAGLLFVQRHGSFKNQPFLCDNALWKGDEEKFFRCSRFFTQGNNVKEETLIVGDLNGNFCKALGEKHNPRNPNDPPVVITDCSQGEKCSCYEITHKIVGSVVDDGARGEDRGNPQGKGPPGSGAGSGKEN